MEDERKLHVSLYQLKQQMDHLTVRGHLLGHAQEKIKEMEINQKHNMANIAILTRTALYLQDKS